MNTEISYVSPTSGRVVVAGQDLRRGDMIAAIPLQLMFPLRPHGSNDTYEVRRQARCWRNAAVFAASCVVSGLDHEYNSKLSQNYRPIMVTNTILEANFDLCLNIVLVSLSSCTPAGQLPAPW